MIVFPPPSICMHFNSLQPAVIERLSEGYYYLYLVGLIKERTHGFFKVRPFPFKEISTSIFIHITFSIMAPVHHVTFRNGANDKSIFPNYVSDVHDTCIASQKPAQRAFYDHFVTYSQNCFANGLYTQLETLPILKVWVWPLMLAN